MLKREDSFLDQGQDLRNGPVLRVDFLSPTVLLHDSASTNIPSNTQPANHRVTGVRSLRSTKQYSHKMDHDNHFSSAWAPSSMSYGQLPMPTTTYVDDGLSREDIDTTADQFVTLAGLQATGSHYRQHSSASADNGLEQTEQFSQPITKGGNRGRRGKRRAQPDRSVTDVSEDDGDVEATKKEKSRAKNKIAAAKCRRTKQMQMEAVETRHRNLSAENAVLKAQRQELHAAVIQLRTWALAHQDCTCGVRQFNMLEAKNMYMVGRFDGIPVVQQPDRTLASSLDVADTSTPL